MRCASAALAAASMILLAVPCAQAAELPPERASFTARTTIDYGGDRLTMTTYNDRGRERQEIQVDDFKQVSILRPDHGRAYMIFPESGTYFDLPIDEVTLLPPRQLLNDLRVLKGEPTRLGGESATLYDVSSPAGSGRQVALKVWVTEDGILLRLEGIIDFNGESESISMIRHNLERGPLAASLFEIPSGMKPSREDGL